MGWAIAIILAVIIIVLFLKKNNNFTITARNLSFIHEILANEYNNQFSDYEILLVVCGIIGTRAYNFSPEQLKYLVYSAKVGKISFLNSLLQMNTIDHNSLPTANTNEKLFLNYVINIEVNIFMIDNKFLQPQGIIEAVLSKKTIIQTAVTESKFSYKKNRRSIWHTSVRNYMNSDDFVTNVKERLNK